MVVPLNSPRWRQLWRHDIPSLIREMEAETDPDFTGEGAWCDVYSTLFHQRSTYPVTYAALPHIARIGAKGTVWQRVAVMCLFGEIRICSFPDSEIPTDLLADFPPPRPVALAGSR